MTGDSPRVLVVEDERELADLYGDWLSNRYKTDVAYSGTDAQNRLEQKRYQVVLLDRRMPDLSGDELLDTIREQNLDCRVAMVTAVSPDFDIIEMGFDSYVVKPVTADDLYDVVERLSNLNEYERQVQQLYTLIDKRAALKAEKTADQLAASEAYSTLNGEIEGIQADTRASLSAMDDDDIHSLMQSLASTEGN